VKKRLFYGGEEDFSRCTAGVIPMVRTIETNAQQD